jgi:hypothetical protein
MDLIAAVLTAAYSLLSREFVIAGITLSFLQVAIWSVVASLLIWFVRRLMS